MQLQDIINKNIIIRKTWKLVLDRNIRWNAIYSIIRRVIELKLALIKYTK
jgi:hypothetical protein